MPLLDVILGYDCNLFCNYCTITPQMRLRSLPTERLVEAMVRGRKLGYDSIAFTGGEPTQRADLISLVKFARAQGYADVKVQSNGLLLAHAANADRLILAGVNRFHISIHTHDAAAYDALVQREGSYPLMVQAIDLLAARPVTLVADVILKEDTYRRLPDALRWLHAHRVTRADLWFVSLTDGNAANPESMPRMSDVLPQLHEALAFAREHGMTVRSLHLPRCLLGADAAAAWDPGSEPVMVVSPEATFELKDSKLAGRRYVEACGRCALRGVCPGIRPDYLDRYGAAEFVPVTS
ncbi:MAG: radical SAM protein [Archangiaceae bacterium]|nr:radical SAM protein [Archangiaceae bacterium]